MNESLLAVYNQSIQIEPEFYEALRRFASKSSHVVEFGVYHFDSFFALLLGLTQNGSDRKSYVGVDLGLPPPERKQLAEGLAKEVGCEFSHHVANDLDARVLDTDFLVIDSLHTYCHATTLLETNSLNVRKFIAMHDTAGCFGKADQQTSTACDQRYLAWIDREKQGVLTAADDFLARHPEWSIAERETRGNGYTVLHRNLSTARV